METSTEERMLIEDARRALDRAEAQDPKVGPQVDRIRNRIDTLDVRTFQTIGAPPLEATISDALDAMEDSTTTQVYASDAQTEPARAALAEALREDADAAQRLRAQRRERTATPERAEDEADQADGNETFEPWDDRLYDKDRTGQEFRHVDALSEDGIAEYQRLRAATDAPETPEATTFENHSAPYSGGLYLDKADMMGEPGVTVMVGTTWSTVVSAEDAQRVGAAIESRSDVKVPSIYGAGGVTVRGDALTVDTGRDSGTHRIVPDDRAAIGKAFVDHGIAAEAVQAAPGRPGAPTPAAGPESAPAGPEKPEDGTPEGLRAQPDAGAAVEPVASDEVARRYDLEHRTNDDRSVTYVDRDGRDTMTDRGDGIQLHGNDPKTLAAAVSLAKERFPNGIEINVKDEKTRDAILEEAARQGVPVGNPELAERYAALRAQHEQAQEVAPEVRSRNEVRSQPPEQAADQPAEQPQDADQQRQERLASALAKTREALSPAILRPSARTPQTEPRREQTAQLEP